MPQHRSPGHCGRHGHEIHDRDHGQQGGSAAKAQGGEADAFQAGMLLLLALLIATPGPSIKQRLIFTVAAIVLTFALHTGSLVIMSTREPAMRPILVLVASVGFYLFPVIIWAVFLTIFRRKQPRVTTPVPKEKHESSTLLLRASERNR